MKVDFIQVMGSVKLHLNDKSTYVINGVKKQGMIAALALAPDNYVTREKLASLLWGDKLQEHAQSSLRQALSQLRKELSQFSDEIISTDRAGISLLISKDNIDAKCFEKLSKQNDVTSLESAVELFSGLPLENIRIDEEAFNDWQRNLHLSFEENYRQVIDRLINEYLRTEEFEKSVRYCQLVLRLDPADEKVHRYLIKIYALENNLNMALKQYEKCKISLQNDYEAFPSLETSKLIDSIKSGHFQLENQKATELLASKNAHTLQPWGASLCVVPFQYASNDVEAGRLSTKLSEDLLIAISRFKWIATKSSGSSLLKRKEGISAVKIAKELEANFVLDGYFRRQGDGIFISLELIDVELDSIVWSERYSLDVAYQDDVSELLISKIASRMEIRLRGHLANTAQLIPSSELSAFQLALQGINLMYEMTEDSYIKAISFFDRAKRDNPTLSQVYSWNALWEIFCHGQNWKKLNSNSASQAHSLAKTAIKHDPEDAIGLAILAHCEAFILHEFDYANELFDQALYLNPHSSFIWMFSAATCAYSGNPEEALKRLEKASEICITEPYFNFMYNSAHCISYLLNGDYEIAANWGRRTVRENPDFSNGIKQLLICLGKLGEAKEAQKYIFLLKDLEPDFDGEQFLQSYPLKKTSDQVMFREAVSNLGLL